MVHTALLGTAESRKTEEQENQGEEASIRAVSSLLHYATTTNCLIEKLVSKYIQMAYS